MDDDGDFFGEMPEDDLGTAPDPTDEIDAINDETFGCDITANDDELEDYAAQTASLRLDDWGRPGPSKNVAPDISQIPMPSFDFDLSAFQSSTNFDSLWGAGSSGLFNIWGGGSTVVPQSADPEPLSAEDYEKLISSGILKPEPTATTSSIGTTTSSFTNRASPFATLSQTPVKNGVPPMPKGPTLEELERAHTLSTPKSAPAPSSSSIPSLPRTALSADDLERQMLEEVMRMQQMKLAQPETTANILDKLLAGSGGGAAAAAVQQIRPQMPPAAGVVPQNGSMPPPPMGRLPVPYGMPPSGPMSPGQKMPMPPPPFGPPMPPTGFGVPPPLAGAWLDLLTGRSKVLPPGCPPPLPIVQHMLAQTKDPHMVFAMLVRPPMPPPPQPPVGGDPRMGQQFVRRVPGMPSGRTIKDLALDQFAGYMSCKEREWLVKIQLLQCNGATGNPYEDDYYYSHWRAKRLAEGWKPSERHEPEDAAAKEKENRIKAYERRASRVNRVRRDSESQRDSTKEPKEHVPFAVKYPGNLGVPSKSTTANPRHLISVAIELNDEQEEELKRAGVQKKLRTLLIKIESAIVLLMECDDAKKAVAGGFKRQNEAVEEIEAKTALVFNELMGEELSKVVQLSKGRSTIVRLMRCSFLPRQLQAVLRLFTSLSSNRKSHSELSLELMPSIVAVLDSCTREQLLSFVTALSESMNGIKEALAAKNTFARDLVLTLLMVCAKKKANANAAFFLWIRGPAAGDENWATGWSTPISFWISAARFAHADVRYLAEWVALLAPEAKTGSVASRIAAALLASLGK